MHQFFSMQHAVPQFISPQAGRLSLTNTGCQFFSMKDAVPKQENPKPMPKKTTHTNILIKGLYRTGSHALVDLLSEYDIVGVFPFEFNHFRAPANVADQLDPELKKYWPNLIEKTLREHDLKWKIFRKAIPDSIISNKLSSGFLQRFPALIDAVSKRKYELSLKKLNVVLQSDLSEDIKIKSACDWIVEIAHIYAHERDFLLFDQPILPSTNINIWTKVFEPYKMIFSIRDPRDQFADIIRSGFLFQPYDAPFQTWAGGLIEIIYGRDRKGAFKMFRDAVKRLYDDLLFIYNSIPKENLLIVDFEDVVRNYDQQKAIIEKFLGIPPKLHINSRTQLIPEKSSENVGIFRDFLNNHEIESLSEINDHYKKWKLKTVEF